MSKYPTKKAEKVIETVEALDQDRQEIKEIIEILDDEESNMDMDSAITRIRRVVERDVP